MQAMKEKISNMASVAKERVDRQKANLEEKMEKSSARTEREEEIAHERRKAKEAEAKMQMYAEKAEHKAQREMVEHGRQDRHVVNGHEQLLSTHNHHGHHYRPTTFPPPTGATEPAYPVTQHPPAEKYF